MKGVNTTIPGMAQFTMTGYTKLGLGATTPNLADSQNRQLISDFTGIRGKHSVKFGVNFSWLQAYLFNPQDALGVFTLDGNFTRDPKISRDGNAVTDLLLGYPFQGQPSTFASMNMRAPFHDFSSRTSGAPQADSS